jgi:hypothetical protein
MPTNFSSGQDDVALAPKGVVVMSQGKLSKAYVDAKDKDIEDALCLLGALRTSIAGQKEVVGIQLEVVNKTLTDIKNCLLKALI